MADFKRIVPFQFAPRFHLLPIGVATDNIMEFFLLNSAQSSHSLPLEAQDGCTVPIISHFLLPFSFEPQDKIAGAQITDGPIDLVPLLCDKGSYRSNLHTNYQ